MMTLDVFLKSDLSMAAESEDTLVFSSSEHDLRPLVHFLAQSKDRPIKPLTLFDRFVGRAGALLMTLVNPQKVYAGVISDGGVDVFERAGISFDARERVPHLMGVASDGMCRWEKLSRGMSPKTFYEAVKIEFTTETDSAD